MSNAQPSDMVERSAPAHTGVAHPAGDPAPTTIVFDVGEVLIDETRVWSVWADIVGVSPLTLGAVLGAAIVQGLDWVDAMAELAPNLQWQEFEAEHEQRYGGFTMDDLYPDVRPCMAALVDAGFMVVVAGNQPARRRAQLTALDLPVTALATSEDLGAEKPAPAFWEAMMTLADADDPAGVLYVGDRIDNDILPASDHGLRTCWLRRGPWGRLQEPSDDVSIDLVLEGLGELPTLLEAWQSP